MHAFLNTAVKAAREAGDIISRAHFQRTHLKITQKGENDFVTQIDQAAERAIVNTIAQAYPTHSIMAEESGETKGDEDYVWIIDPLDGTTNFIRGLPQFSVSIGLQVQGKLEHAVVYQPVTQDLFTASRGRGAQLNGHRIRVSTLSSPQGMLFSAGLPHDRTQFPLFEQVSQFINQERGLLRRAGSTALDMAYVASGALDAFWVVGAKAWDVAAGALLIREAGGLVLDTNGGEDFLFGQSVVAAPTKLMRHILPGVRG